MSPHSKKLSLFIASIFLLVSCLVVLALYKKINQNDSLAQAAEVEWQTQTNQREQINSLDSALASIESEKVKLESHFTQSSDIVPFLDTVERLGKEANADATVSSVDILKDNSGLSVGMKATGTFEAVYKFLLLLENSPYEFEFTSASMQSDAGTSTGDGSPKNTGWTAIFKVRLLSFVP